MSSDPYPIETTTLAAVPLLREIPEPPQSLTYRGRLPDPELTLLTIVGSRAYTSYGKQVVDELVRGLAGHPIGIVSGLALGIDSLAHEAALRYHLYTLAIPGGGLQDQVLYPARHRGLAQRILAAGGGLLSEFAPDFRATKWSFPQRNRLVAGISHGTLLIEAGEKSGTLITARLAVDYNRELMVVPGSIFSARSAGTHQFLKLGATPVTESRDILDALGLDAHDRVAPTQPALTPADHPPEVARVLELLAEPLHRDTLIRALKLPTTDAIRLLTTLELQDLITEEQQIYRRRR
ncbi:MAG: DNA-processing protein DprA [Patescibacteria group bacterium]